MDVTEIEEHVPRKRTRQTGGCLCGDLRYTAVPDPDSAYYCHCRDCQIGSGSAFHAAVIVDEAEFAIVSGTIATYSKVADSGNRIDRAFCPRCGTPIYWVGDGFPGAVVITLSSLDDCAQISPAKEVWTRSAASWSRIPDEIERFERRPGPN